MNYKPCVADIARLILSAAAFSQLEVDAHAPIKEHSRRDPLPLEF